MEGQRQVDVEAVQKAAREFRAAFLLEWQTGVLPYDTFNRAADEGAIRFAELVMKSALLLNGGGLVLMPPAASMFALKPDTVGTEIAGAAGYFIGGLVAAWVMTFFAFFSMRCAALGALANREKSAESLKISFGYVKKEDSNPSPDDYEKARKKYTKLGQTLMWLGILLSLISMSLFACGVLAGACVILKGPVITIFGWSP